MASRGRARARQRGMALLGALVVVTVVVAVAAAMGLRSAHGIAATAREFEMRGATALFEQLENEARRVLARDARGEAFDGEEDPWALATLLADAPGGHGSAALRDRQGLFNLRDIAFSADVLAAGSGLPPEDEAGENQAPPAPDAATGAAADQQAALDDGAGGALMPRRRGAARAGGAAGAEVDADSMGMLALASVPGVASASMANGAAGNGQDLVLTAQQVALARFALLLSALDIDDAVLPAVLDWLDPDGDQRFPNGAEDEYYTRLERPYRTANRAFVDVSELRLVRGIDAQAYEKLRKFVTVLPESTSINVNTAPIEVLMSLSPALDRSTAEMIMQTRRVRPFRSVEEFRALPVLLGRPLVSEGLTVSSQYFALDMRVESGQSQLAARALLARPGGDTVVVLEREKGWFDE